MRRQLSRRRNFPGSADRDLTKDRQLFFGNRSAAHDVDLAIAHGNNGRFNSVQSRSGIDDHRDPSAELIENMPRRRRADTTKSICAWRSQRFSKSANDF